MSLDSNKNVVRRYFEAANSTLPRNVLALLSEDFHFKMMPREPEWLCAEMNRDQFASAMVRMSDLMSSPIQMQIVSMTAEEDRVAVEATSFGPMKSGPNYENRYHFLFRVRNGKIQEAREYSCSYHAAKIFGPSASETILTGTE